MPGSWSLTNNKWNIDLMDPVDPQLLETVHQKLDAGEIDSIGFYNSDASLPLSLNLAHINHLALKGTPCEGLEFLSSIRKLESLSLNYFSNPEAGKKIRLDSIPSCEHLISLNLSRVDGLGKIPAFPNLKRLRLETVKGVGKMPSFPVVERLSLDEIKESFAFLSLFPAVKDLMISGSSIQDANHLLHCSNLLRLCMIQDRDVDFESIAAAGTINHSLKILEISHCPSLTSFDFLSCFDALKYLDVGSCRKLKSFAGIDRCPNIDSVNISECHVVDKSLNYLLNIPRVFLGIKYSKEEIAAFEKIFKGDIYSIYTFENEDFDYLSHYEKYFRQDINEVEKYI